MPKVSIKKKKKGIRYRCDAERQAIRYNVQRRVGSTRHELMRQLPPVPRPVSRKLLVRKERILAEIPGCVYCGADATTQDHFEPLVINGMPSGIIPTDLDVVPCCAWPYCVVLRFLRPAVAGLGRPLAGFGQPLARNWPAVANQSWPWPRPWPANGWLANARQHTQ